MKTRTLLLLALGCGIAIMLAGAVLFVQLSRQDEIVAPIPLGAVTTVADMSVAVDSAIESDGLLTVSLRLAGVDDDDGGRGFRLIASGRPVLPEPPNDTDCVETTVVEVTCTVRFDVTAADGSSRVLFYERGEQQARWVLA